MSESTLKLMTLAFLLKSTCLVGSPAVTADTPINRIGSFVYICTDDYAVLLTFIKVLVCEGHRFYYSLCVFISFN